MYFQILIACILSLLIHHQDISAEINAYCQDQQGQYTNSPPTLPSLPNSYHTILEANFHSGTGDNGIAETVNVEEWYSEPDNFGKVILQDSFGETTLYYDYAHNQLITASLKFSDEKTKCEVSQLSGSSYRFIYGYRNSSSGGRIYSVRDALRFGAQFNETYIGKEPIRGVVTNHWRSCQHSTALNSLFTLDTYFTSLDDWSPATPVANLSIPVRFLVTGINTQAGTNFTNTYEFIKFEAYPNLVEEQKFLTPSGVYCPGRAQTKPLPIMPPQFTYKEEITYPYRGVSIVGNTWYDSRRNLVRYDHTPVEEYGPWFTTNELTEVHDFNTGVSYVTDNLIGNCSIVPLAAAQFESYMNYTTGKSTYLRIISSKRLFHSSGNFYYEGQKTVRGILCDVYISYVPNLYSKNGPGTLTQIYYTSDTWQEFSTGGFSRLDKFPVQMIVKLDNPDSLEDTAVYNFFDFTRQSAVNEGVYDVDQCFDESNKVHFIMRFPGPDAAEIQNTIASIPIVLKSIIYNELNVSPLRVQRPEVVYDLGGLYVISTLLEKPPNIKRYTQDGFLNTIIGADHAVQKVASVQDCSTQCENHADVICNSFDYCSVEKMCLLSHLRDPHVSMNSTGHCQHWMRNVPAVNVSEPSLSEAKIQLTNGVYSGKYTFVVNGRYKWFKFIATSIRYGIARDKERNGDSEFLNLFSYKKNNVILLNNLKSIPGIAIDDCARRCLQEASFDCQSFDFCYKIGQCLLSNIHPSEKPNLVTNHSFCDLYSRNYIDKFIVSPGKASATKSDVELINIQSSEQCAQECIKSTSITCKSFDWCDDSNSCHLLRTHVLDVQINVTVAHPSCSHYSRKFIDDFKLMEVNETWKLEDGVLFTSISAWQCAKLCVEEESGNCTEFHYCDVDTEPKCFLRTRNMHHLDTGQVIDQKWATCQRYEREYTPTGRQIQVKVQKIVQYVTKEVTKEKNVGLSTGSVVGIAVGCAVIGVLIGVGVILIINKRKDLASDMQLMVTPESYRSPSD